MAGNVTGSIGNEEVVLNNAATESTLAALLKNAQGDSAVLKALAVKAGVDAAAIAAVESASQGAAEGLEDISGSSVLARDGLDALNKRIQNTGAVLGELNAAFNKAISGTLQTSDLLSSLSKIPGPAGFVASGLMRIAQFQEENMKVYQEISASGVNFGGSLTDLRLAAASTYMTLDGFATLMKNNSAAFMQIGGSVNAGAIAFSKFSGSILNSEVGKQLMALGYTADEASQGMATYLAAAGNSNAKDLASNAALRAGAIGYLEELDRLADVTGKSRKEQEDIMKKQQLDAEIQMTSARMAPADRARFEQNVKYMTMMYGDAGKDMALAQAQHRSVITKEGQTLTAIAPGMQEAMAKMAQAQIGSQEYLDAQNEMSIAAQQGLSQIPIAAFSANDSLKKLSQAQLTVASQEKANLTTKEALNARDIQIAEEKADRETSEAAAMAAANKGLKDLGSALIGLFSPLISVVTPAFGYLGEKLSGFAEYINNLEAPTKNLAAGLILLLGSVTAYYIWQKKKLIEDAAGGAMKTIAGGAGKAAGSSGGAGALGELGKVGGGIGPVLEGLAAGLKAFANPIVVAGAVGLAAALGIIITGVGAGIAAAAYLIGKSLPTMAEGLDSFSKINGSNLVDVSKGIGALGLAMAAFGAGSAVVAVGAGISSLIGGVSKLFGGDDVMGKITKSVQQFTPVLPQLTALGPAIQSYASGLASFGTAINSINITKAEQVRALLAKPMPAAPLAASGAALTASATALNATSGSGENKASDVDALNKTMMEVLKYIKDTAENTKRTHEATKMLNGNMFVT